MSLFLSFLFYISIGSSSKLARNPTLHIDRRSNEKESISEKKGNIIIKYLIFCCFPLFVM